MVLAWKTAIIHGARGVIGARSSRSTASALAGVAEAPDEERACLVEQELLASRPGAGTVRHVSQRLLEDARSPEAGPLPRTALASVRGEGGLQRIRHGSAGPRDRTELEAAKRRTPRR